MASDGLLDTSVVIDFERIPAEQLPDLVAISALTLAELVGGLRTVVQPGERLARLQRLQKAESLFGVPIPFDDRAAHAYGDICVRVVAIGRKFKGRRSVDLLIAATALANEYALYTRNPDDVRGLDDILEIVAI